MNKINQHLNVYYNYNLIRNKPGILINKLQQCLLKLNISTRSKEVYNIERSIQYPMKNGVFVVLLDRCSPDEFINFLRHGTINKQNIGYINKFESRVSLLQNNSQLIDINNFKYPKFTHKHVNKYSHIKPKLTYLKA